MSAKQDDVPTTVLLPQIDVLRLAENASICMSVPLGDPSDPMCQRGVTPIYWGVPGIGKSAIMRAAAKMAQLHMETMYPSHHNPEDFGSQDVPDGMGGWKTVCCLPQIRRLMARGEGVLLVDEAGNAPPAVQSASLSLILERNVGDDTLPPGIRILAAANPVECAAGGWDFEAPTANRFLHFATPKPSSQQWLKWYMGDGALNANPAEAMWDKVETNWASGYARAKGLIAGFIQAKGAENLHNMPVEEDPNRSRAWPSPRMWEIAGRCAGTLFALGKENLIDTFIHAAVGSASSIEFATWMKSADLPSPEDMLRHGWKPDRRRLDISVGALASMIEFVTKSEEPKAWAVPAWKILNACCEEGMTDLAMASTEMMVDAGLAADDVGDAIIDAAKPVVRRLNKSKIANLALGIP